MEIRDQVFAGTHPRLKLLFPVDPKTGEAMKVPSQPPSSSQKAGSITRPIQASQELPVNAKESRLPVPPSNVQPYAPAGSASAGAGASGIDPIFLTKSDVLLKAEIQQKRQRIERNLADQVKEKRVLDKQRVSDEFDLPDFDVAEVLRKAQEIVKPVRFTEISGANANASASDSFDENTFYSSQMNDSTPETTDKPEPVQKMAPTQNCRYFLRGDKCPYGEQCLFAHDPAARINAQGQKLHVQNADKNADPHGSSGAQDKNKQGPLNRHTISEPLSQAERIAQLEAELRELRAEDPDKGIRPTQINTRKAQEVQEEESVYSPPDAVPPKSNEVPSGRRKDVGYQQQQRSSAHMGTSTHEHPRYENPARSPVLGEGRVVRNHITSPLAPQPARVSPLAMAKAPPISQGQRQQRHLNDPFGEPNNGVSPGQTAQAQRQATNPKKRKKGRDSGERVRNVVPRREMPSPEIRVKEEPMSPPPFAGPTERWASRRQEEGPGPIYIDEVSPRYQNPGEVVYRPQLIERPAPRYVLDEYREPTGPRYEPELRRVVSTRQIRPPMADTERYLSPRPRSPRPASQMYIPRLEQEVPIPQYRSSMQPETVSYLDRDRAPSPKAHEMATMMAPPPRRIVVDKYGNRFYEQEVSSTARPRPSSIAPVTRQGPLEHRFQSPALRHSVARLAQPADDLSEPRYIRQGPSPPPQYVRYVSPTNIRPSVQQDPEVFYGGEAQSRRIDGARMAEYPSANTGGRYEEFRPMERISRVSSVRPLGHHYEGGTERISRVQSVHPDSRRIISYGGEMIPQSTRQMSVRPEETYARPMDYSQSGMQYYPGTEGRGGII
ncbi:MAG: hypothetical protein Q9219_005066 [cf. Caloplaca sp. 3 TL-2023]